MQMNKKVYNTTTWRLYNRMFVTLEIHQNSLQISSRWFRYKKKELDDDPSNSVHRVSEARDKLANTELNKLKSPANNKAGTTLKVTTKNVQNEELPHELFLAIRQK